MRVAVLTTGLLQAFTAASAVSRKRCQYPTPEPLDGCPADTVLVGPLQHFNTVQSAILSLPHDTSPQHILVLPGNYTEQVNITRAGPVYLYGQTKDPNDQSKNTVNIIWHNATGAAVHSTLDNAYTSVLTVAPTFNSSTTGSGPNGNPVPADTAFGNTDFRAYNLNLINDFKPYTSGPSLAVSVSYANAGFYHCGFYSYQDTVYIGKLANAYFYRSEIAGQTDFVYGFGTAWIQSSLLSLRGCSGGITAWKGSTTAFANKYGVYIHDSRVAKANASLALARTCALGRPWNALHRSLFVDTDLDESVLPAGYVAWSAADPRVVPNVTTMAEYHNRGPGWNATARAAGAVGVVLSAAQYELYSSVEKVFQYPGEGRFGNVGWIDRDVEGEVSGYVNQGQPLNL